INMDNPIDVDGNLIISGGVVKGVSGFSCGPAGCTCNQAANGVVVNVDGDFIMSGGEWNDFSCGANASTGMAMAIGGNVQITGGLIKMNTKTTSKLDLVPTVVSTTWNQTGGTVTLGNTNIKSGKTVTLIGSKIGDVGTSTALTVETGGKLMTSNFPVTGTGNFTLQTGAHLGIGSAAGITASGASGNVQVSGTRSYNSGATYEYYEGLSPQATGNFTTTTTSGTYPASVANLIINKTSASNLVNLTSTTDVTTNLQLTSGVLNTSLTPAAAPWIRIPAAATVTPAGGSPSSYVDGFIRRQGATDFNFPTGNAGRWSRVGILAPSVATEFEARYVAAQFSNTTTMAAAPITVLDHVSKREHWIVNRMIADGASTKVRLYWEDADWSIIYKFDSLSVGRWSGSAWENSNCYAACPANWTTSTAQRTYAGSVNAVGASGYVQSNTTTLFGPFTLSSVGLLSLNPLPVELLAFQAECSNKGDVELSWTTATEQNNDFFTLERSTDGASFEQVGWVQGAGTTSQLTNYSYYDREAMNGVNYYRLTQTDIDGTSERLKTISVRCGSNSGGMVNVYNNNQGQLVVQVEGDRDNRYQVRVFDSLGKMVLDYKFNSPTGNTTEKLDIANLEKGVYYVQVHDQLQGSTNKISVH
ncbi:MAG: T9SS type A sorting domain-containing protein, partial [Bacteroidota bacterium]